MEFNAIVDSKARSASGCAVIGVYENGELDAAARLIDAHTGGLIGRLIAGGDFAAKLGDTLLLPQPAGAPQERVLLTGLGPRAGFGRRQYRKALQASAQALLKTGAGDATVYLAQHEVSGMDGHFRARAVAEIFSSSAYRIPDLKSGAKPKASKLARVHVAAESARTLKSTAAGLQIGAAVGHGSALARDLANLPPNVCTPTYLGERAEALAKEWPRIKAKVLDEEAIRALKMGAFLAVTQGSA
jgi:leucyl aminopeptidase